MTSAQRSFTGTQRLYGVAGARAIAQAHVVVIGIGGVGSWAAEALARAGVGTLTLMDLDHVAESNLNRQIHATLHTVGQAKVLAMQERIHSFNPQCSVQVVDEFVTPQNWGDLLPPQAHAVIDACDQIHTKVALAAWSLRDSRHFISVGAAGGKRLAHETRIEDLAHVTHDPLLAQVRYRLRKQHNAPAHGKRMRVNCVFSKEAVAQPHASCTIDDTNPRDNSLNCHGYGSVVSVTATFGLCAAGWVLNKISEQF